MSSKRFDVMTNNTLYFTIIVRALIGPGAYIPGRCQLHASTPYVHTFLLLLTPAGKVKSAVAIVRPSRVRGRYH